MYNNKIIIKLIKYDKIIIILIIIIKFFFVYKVFIKCDIFLFGIDQHVFMIFFTQYTQFFFSFKFYKQTIYKNYFTKVY